MLEGVPVAEILGISACLVLSAFFSGSETAITSLPRAKVQQAVDQSGGRSILRLVLTSPVELLTTILIGNNIVNITASALATEVAETLLGGAGDGFVNPVAVAVGVMTLLLLAFGEITPKSLARANAEWLAPWLLYVLWPMMWALKPVSKAFVALSHGASRLAGAPLDAVGPSVSEDEIEYLVELGRREGSLSEEREDLLRGVFGFTETTVREVMVPRTDAVMVPATINEAELHRLFVRVGHSRLPVYQRDTDDILGLVYAKDLLRFLADRKPDEPFQLKRVLRRPEFVPQSKPISELLRDMQARRVHMAIAIDEFGGVAGLITLEDIIEEMFGEIRDEYDVEQDAVQLESEGVWLVEGRLNLEDLGEALEVEDLVDEESDTVGGLVVNALGAVPAVGAVVEFRGLRFTVVEADQRRVLRVRVERVPVELLRPE